MSEMNSMGLLGPIMADEDNLKVEKAEQSETVVNKKVEIPQCAIDVIENAKEKGHSLYKAMDIFGKTKTFCDWIDLPANQELFVRAWLEGYEEIRYFVKVKNVRNGNDVLRYDESGNYWDFGSVNEYASFRTKHTRKELEKADFGEVFDNPLFDVEEIKTKSKSVNK